VKNHFVTSFKVLGVLTVLLGFIYPLTVTFVAQQFFYEQANGSLIKQEGRILGSSLIAQKTVSEKYFWPRPSASDYGTVPSGASNQGYISKALKQAVEERKAKGLTHDLLFTSGSGLDPHISKDAALGQVSRIVQVRQLSEDDKVKVTEMIERLEEPRDFGFLGEPRVNVLHLNIEMDKIFSK
jgi:potassium-transporting ATPase KdpC subunit